MAFVDDTHLASASGDKLVKLWDIPAGTATDFPGHETAVLAVAADPAGGRLVSGSADKTVRAWDAKTGKTAWTWPGKSAVCAVAVRPGGGQVAVGTADGMLTVLATKGDKAEVIAAESAHQAGTAAVAYTPDGARLGTCGGDGVVRVWELSDTGAPTPGPKFVPPARPGASANPMSALAFTADGRFLAAAGADGIVHVWDVQAGTEVRGLRGHTDWVTAAAFRPDGQALVSVAADQAVRVFDLSRRDTESAGGHSLPIRGVAVSRDGVRAATASEDRTVKVWEIATGKELATLTGAGDPLNAVAFAGPDTVVAAGDDLWVRWWAVGPAKEVRKASSDRVFNLAATPDGDSVAGVWAKPDDKVAAFDIFSGDGKSPPVQVREEDRILSCAAIAADATVGITGGADGVVRVWDLTTQERVGGDWPLFADAVADIGLTPDKKTLVAIDVNGTVKVADATTREVKETIKSAVPAGEVYAMTVSRTGDKFATLSDAGEVKLWSMAGKELRSWKLPTPANAAGFTPDGKRLVTGNRDGTLYVLELPERN